MWPLQNHVNITGWIDQILYPKRSPRHGEHFVFRLLEPGYHEHFHSAQQDINNCLSIEVYAYGSELARLCSSHLKVSDRVQVCGRLVPCLAFEQRRGVGLSIEAWKIERTETLESFRFVNHRWNYELDQDSVNGPLVRLAQIPVVSAENKENVS